MRKGEDRNLKGTKRNLGHNRAVWESEGWIGTLREVNPLRSFIQDRAIPPTVELHLGSGNPATDIHQSAVSGEITPAEVRLMSSGRAKAG